MSKELPITLRLANEADLPFIFNSWLRSYKTSHFAKNIESTIYYSEQHKVIEKLLQSYDTIVACDPNDSSQIYGFINAGYTDNFFTLNYIYVKHTFRHMGIGKSLLNAFDHDNQYIGIYTHANHVARKLDQKYNMIYHPYVGLNPEQYNTVKASQAEETPQLDHDNLEAADATQGQPNG